eukprot:CAMPEP_0195527760 /NCGR_PEP_ID=MMETSP0794_2-20130614/29664_1 /TAXON_ID=515487 /ORGANISM="Stephanopyxis turris, Strain CCMP 815" /LENGTH=500 /DNA_ID=CAMNT_0040658751 /DNA_START=417 /DNA_END=1919 /DNA_ORIENTATION=+
MSKSGDNSIQHDTNTMIHPNTNDGDEESVSSASQIYESASQMSAVSPDNLNRILLNMKLDRYGFVVGKTYDDDCSSEEDGSISESVAHDMEDIEENEASDLPSPSSFLLQHHENGRNNEDNISPLRSHQRSRKKSTPRETPVDSDMLSLQQRRGAELSDAERRRRLALERKREKKWVKMIKRWDGLHNDERKKNKKLLRMRVRKGVPNTFRGAVWTMLAGVPGKVFKTQVGKYKGLVLSTEVPNQDTMDTIDRDIHRTFPRHMMFIEEAMRAKEAEAKDEELAAQGIEAATSEEDDFVNAKGGQASLRRVLRAYSLYDTDVGYCQGMNFIAATFITFMPEEEAFWMLVSVMNEKPCLMRGLFGKRMSQTQEILFVAEKLVAQFFPRLYQHFENESIHITMFATQWLLTVYTSSFPFDLVTRVWDCFISEGWKIVYRVMLALLKISTPVLMKCRFEDMLGHLTAIPATVDGDAVMKVAFKIPLRKRHVRKYQREWQSRDAD